MKSINAVVAAGMADAEPRRLLNQAPALEIARMDRHPRRRRPLRRALIVGWQALLLGFALGGLACLVFLASGI